VQVHVDDVAHVGGVDADLLELRGHLVAKGMIVCELNRTIEERAARGCLRMVKEPQRKSASASSHPGEETNVSEQVDLNADDLTHMQRAIELANDGYDGGNLAVGSVVTLSGERIAEGHNTMIVPVYDPIWHAEMTTMRSVPAKLWPRAGQMTCFTTLEPCVMCTTALLMHGFGRVVYGSSDPDVGGGVLLAHLPPYYDGGHGVPEWLGPCLPADCDPLRALSHERFARLPVGHESQ
jgi:tRNA(Arg) A34 adenosine deaminase TadA